MLLRMKWERINRNETHRPFPFRPLRCRPSALRLWDQIKPNKKESKSTANQSAPASIKPGFALVHRRVFRVHVLAWIG